MRFKLFVFLLFATYSAYGCPFCDPAILAKQAVHENAHALTLYSLTPATKGNLLIIPKRHVERFEALTAEEMGAIQAEITLFAAVFKDFYEISDYFLLQKNGRRAGQSVPHLHFHMIPTPRSIEEIVEKAFHYREKLSDEEMALRTQELRDFLQTYLD